MDVPFAIHVDARGVETLPPQQANLVIKARSCRNTLGILKRRLTQLRHDKAHTLEDVEHYRYVLEHLGQRWRDEEGTFAGALAEVDHHLATSCSQLWTHCLDMVTHMEEEALQMSPEMAAVHSRLADLQRRLQDLLQREHSSAEVQQLAGELQEIDAARVEQGGVFWGDVEAPAPGQAICNELLSYDMELVRECARTAQNVPPELMAVEDKLREIHNHLRQLAGRQHHTSADVQHFRFLLGAIASAEAEYQGEWQDSHAKALLDRCLDMVDDLEASAEAMPPALAEVHGQLALMHKELHAMASTGQPPAGGDLQRLQSALDRIDNQRAHSGGVFGGGEAGEEGGIKAPPGQAVCAHLLEECYSLLHELQGRVG